MPIVSQCRENTQTQLGPCVVSLLISFSEEKHGNLIKPRQAAHVFPILLAATSYRMSVLYYNHDSPDAAVKAKPNRP
jgi:hypothetical protein